MVREVGFEPTNPYGTGASGLRVQDPFSHPRVSLTWLGNTSRRKTADSRTPARTAPAENQARDKALIGFPQRRHFIKNRKMFNSSPTHPRDKPGPLLS